MKKIIFCLMATCLSFAFFPLLSSAQKDVSPLSLTTPKTSEREEIKTMRQELNQSTVQKKPELKSSKKSNSKQVVVGTSGHRHGGTYISVGGLLLILLLIIILV